MSKKVRVRFAPSPTGGLHLGGVRTALYNYLFARQNAGDFILRIEDTDQGRYVPGAEKYIFDCLQWCSLISNENPLIGGSYGPYRQSERKVLYRQYADYLIQQGNAYYAFDPPEELEAFRSRFQTAENPSPQYDHSTRMQMINSCSLSATETRRMLAENIPYVIRIKMPANETVLLHDKVKGEICFNTGLVDDKVLLKADGMPTYHLAVVVDDYLMKITHVFRGEEWLSSAPVHLLLWKYLGWEKDMPEWVHLPLILKPDGNEKLSKRDGERLGFPVFAMNWTNQGTNEVSRGYRELGFLPEAFLNMLALLGWNDGSNQELFSLAELIEKFSLRKVHTSGARFNYDKAKWFNHEWIKRSSTARLIPEVKELFVKEGLLWQSEHQLEKVIELVKDRCTLLTDFITQTQFFFRRPQSWDLDTIKSKWSAEKRTFFSQLLRDLEGISKWEVQSVQRCYQDLAASKNFKSSEIFLPLRIMLVGGKFGPDVFEIANLIGKSETINRIQFVLDQL